MTQGGWKYAASSVIGTSHRSRPDGVCQDSNACGYIDTGSPILYTVVSDGAGSSSRSECGSRCACEHVESRVIQATSEALFTRDFAVDVLHGLQQRLQDLAYEAGL